jgi:uncharacterized protein (DUF58 family)
MEIRPPFWGVFVLLLVSVVGVFMLGSTQGGFFLRLAYLCGFLIIVSWVWSTFSVRHFVLTRFARGIRQQLGQVFEERFEVTNTSKFMRPWLAVTDGSDLPGSGGSRVLSRINRREVRNYSAYTLLVKRGQIHLGPTIYSASDPFGLFISKRQVKGEQSLLVLPYIVDLNSFPFPPGLLPGGIAKRRKTQDITPYAGGVREYAPGDSLNRIHWPSSIRKDRLIVKEFEEDPRADVWIFLDADRDVNISLAQDYIPPKIDHLWMWHKREEVKLPPDTFEYAVSAAASISSYFIKQGQSVGLSSASKHMVILPAERGERQLGKILETLAFLKSDGKLPLTGLVQSQFMQLPRGSTVVLITSSPYKDVIVAVDALLFRDMHPVVVLIDPSSFTQVYGSQTIFQEIKMRRVPVTRVTYGSDLHYALEKGFTHPIEEKIGDVVAKRD